MSRAECPSCGKTFARQSHLARHQEIHRTSPRWPCPNCASSYTRRYEAVLDPWVTLNGIGDPLATSANGVGGIHRDALNRHLARCSGGTAETHVPTGRINRACQACSERKIRCSRGQPCRRCAGLKLACQYLVHGSARRESTLPPVMSPAPLPEMSPAPASAHETISLPVEGINSTIAGEESVTRDGIEQQKTSTAIEHQHDFNDPGDPTPWFSWIWAEPPWDILDSTPSIPTDVAPAQVPNYESFGIEIFDPQTSGTRARMASIIDARIDPVENHRQSILAHIRGALGSNGQGENLRWLMQPHFPLLLKTYFTRHHRHTPIIHLPTFDIVASPTSLIFALALIAASYMPRLGLSARKVADIARCAYKFAVESDECLRSGSGPSLETLQALILLGILDRLMLKRLPGSPHSIDLGEIVRLARTARVFDVPNEAPDSSWRDWAVTESRRRLGLVIFAFDAFISVLHDEVPNVRTDELNLRFPSPEFVFMASTEAEWRESYQLRTWEERPSCSVALTLSGLLCNMEDFTAQLPDTLMGRFVLLHGLLQHAWRTKRVFLENQSVLLDPSRALFMKSRQSAIHNSLQRWHEGWPKELVDFEPFPECPSLYQDRAEVCWYLAGVIILPQATITLSNNSTVSNGGAAISIQQILEGLVSLSDQGKLDSIGHDFEAAYRLVTGQNIANVCSSSMGGLMYREPDSTLAGFEE